MRVWFGISGSFHEMHYLVVILITASCQHCIYCSSICWRYWLL